ncbi:Receptor activity-modifying protein 1 [Collichthys lucidus]|uniref:Receptor activity-modifying protein 1 n=1 Tax=Collichthys lucidus TaxID=240159 RepID=A0A4U5TYP1_COLLU|nr:Receptor activity-modifying protein 1 [Collichthys lucidus]
MITTLQNRIYEGLTNCTYQVALRMDCFWPNQIVDRFFMSIHRIYFHDCAVTGRLLQEPPNSILAPFIGVPVLVTLIMTALVVWRSKRTEGVL